MCLSGEPTVGLCTSRLIWYDIRFFFNVHVMRKSIRIIFWFHAGVKGRMDDMSDFFDMDGLGD